MKVWSALTDKQKVTRWNGVLRVLTKMTRHERKEHFDMAVWGEKTACGTVACIAGHCGLDPSFKRQGFSANFTTDGFLRFNIDVSTFFGSKGYFDIFTDPADIESHADAVREVRKYIKVLEGEAA